MLAHYLMLQRWSNCKIIEQFWTGSFIPEVQLFPDILILIPFLPGGAEEKEVHQKMLWQYSGCDPKFLTVQHAWDRLKQ